MTTPATEGCDLPTRPSRQEELRAFQGFAARLVGNATAHPEMLCTVDELMTEAHPMDPLFQETLVRYVRDHPLAKRLEPRRWVPSERTMLLGDEETGGPVRCLRPRPRWEGAKPRERLR